MQDNRDFKGVWIPKEIWLNEELTMLEKVIFVEIDSLDGPEHCYASNEYFATFCNCSESKVSKAIKKLKELGMIEEVAFDGRHRKLRVVKNATESSKKCYPESQKMLSNNTTSKTSNNKNSSKEELQSGNFQFGKQIKPKKENLYTKCVNMVSDFVSEHNCGEPVRGKLMDYLRFRLEVKDKPLYTNMWKGMLGKLETLHRQGYGYEPVISYSLERGYLSFYAPNDFSSGSIKNKPWEQGVKSETYTEEEKREIERLTAEREARGEQVWY